MKGLILLFLGLLIFSSCGKKGDGDGANFTNDNRTSEETEEDRLKRISAVVALEATEEFSTYLELVQKHEVSDAFQGEEKRTYLVPTNTAFKELSNERMNQLETSPQSFEEMRQTMSLPRPFTLEELQGMEKTTNTEGKTVSVERANNYIWVEGAPITKPDIEFNNGIIHGVDIIYDR